MKRITIGIDPGTVTGYAVWDHELEEFAKVGSGVAVEVEEIVMDYNLHHENIFVRIEDARKRKWYGNNADAKRQGAGSAKRDSSRWEEFCKYYGLEYEMIHPIRGATKLNRDQFKKITGWQGRTNEHGRDAAMMVYNI